MSDAEAGETALRAANVLSRHASGVECFEGHWRRQRTRPHAHPEYQLTWTLAGTGRMTYRSGSARIPVGCMALFHPAEPHVIENDQRARPWSFRVLHLPDRLLRGVLTPLLQPAPFVAVPGLTRAFEAVWQDAVEDKELRGSVKKLARLLAAMPGLEPDRNASAQVVRQCLAHLASVLDRPVAISELSELAHCSGERLRRAFVAATGLPPHAWHLQRRVQQAKHLLAGGSSPAEVAGACGFSDQAHLTRHFTKLVGVSPARYAGALHRAASR
jgi:AraC-like DNA-binding protein